MLDWQAWEVLDWQGSGRCAIGGFISGESRSIYVSNLRGRGKAIYLLDVREELVEELRVGEEG